MTPGGKLQAGDLLRHKATGVLVRVAARSGNDDLYAVYLERVDGEPVLTSGGYKTRWLMIEAAYHIGRSGAYEVVQP